MKVSDLPVYFEYSVKGMLNNLVLLATWLFSLRILGK